MAGLAKIFDDSVLNKSNEKVDLTDEKFKGKIIGLYFSAHWCPPCRRFTPILVDFYEKYHEEKNFEIIFVSSDDDEDSFKEYYQDMPWLTVDHKLEDKREELDKLFKISSIPKLILIDADSGDVLTDDARDQIQNKDKLAEHFPWKEQQKQEENKDEDDDDDD